MSPFLTGHLRSSSLMLPMLSRVSSKEGSSKGTICGNFPGWNHQDESMTFRLCFSPQFSEQPLMSVFWGPRGASDSWWNPQLKPLLVESCQVAESFPVTHPNWKGMASENPQFVHTKKSGQIFTTWTLFLSWVSEQLRVISVCLSHHAFLYAFWMQRGPMGCDPLHIQQKPVSSILVGSKTQKF